jgi:hypothetical protein
MRVTMSGGIHTRAADRCSLCVRGRTGNVRASPRVDRRNDRETVDDGLEAQSGRIFVWAVGEIEAERIAVFRRVVSEAKAKEVGTGC